MKSEREILLDAHETVAQLRQSLGQISPETAQAPATEYLDMREQLFKLLGQIRRNLRKVYYKATPEV